MDKQEFIKDILTNSKYLSLKDRERLMKLCAQEMNSDTVKKQDIELIVREIYQTTKAITNEDSSAIQDNINTSETKNTPLRDTIYLQHNPRETCAFLSEFSRSDECKWFTHRADCDISLESYAKAAEKFLWKYKDKVLYPIFINVLNFISLNDKYINKSWKNYNGDDVYYRWISVKKWVKENPNKDPFDYIVDGEFEFSEYVKEFKNTIQFRTDDPDMTFNNRILDLLYENLVGDIDVSYSENYTQIGGGVNTFVDVKSFFEILKQICRWINEQKSKSNDIYLDMMQDEEVYVLSILHKGSYLNITETKMRGLDGDLNKLRLLAFNNIDFEIDADCGSSLDKLDGKKLTCMDENIKGLMIKEVSDNKKYKVHYKIEQEIIPIECEKVGGVKYIFRFYK